MSTSYVRASTASAAAAAALTLARPGVAEATEPLRAGDWLVCFLGIGNVSAEAATLTLPAEWFTYDVADHTDGSTTSRLFYAFKYIVDLTTEAESYVFTYSASRALVGTILAYRGVLRDVDYDTTNYPYGYFAPYGSAQAASVTGSAATTAAIGAVVTARGLARTLTALIYTHASNAPLLDDPTPLQPIRVVVRVAKIALVVYDVEHANATTAATWTVHSNASGRYLAVTFTIEPIVDVPASFDNYKTKVLRSLFTPPYDPRLSTPLGKLLAVIGKLDNDIGGLFGDADFLPNDPGGDL